MARSPSFCGIVLAAGASSRMGRDKALLPWPPVPPGATAGANTETFLTAQIRLLQRHTELVIVVAGENATSIAPLVYGAGAFLVLNRGPERGQFSSLRVGLQEVLNRGRDAAIIAKVDSPPPLPATLEALKTNFLDQLAAGKPVWAVVPEYRGRHGHPVVIGREMIGAFLGAPDSSTARSVEHAHSGHIAYVPVDDAHVVANIDTPEQYAELQNKVVPEEF